MRLYTALVLGELRGRGSGVLVEGGMLHVGWTTANGDAIHVINMPVNRGQGRVEVCFLHDLI